MSEPFVTDAGTLGQRITGWQQGGGTALQAGLPAYVEAFLAKLRLLIGVPFTYLVPDSELLPDESIRFFYLDRSWTDRLVDGVFAVGKIGSREQAHHAALGQGISQQLDLTERVVRTLQTSTSVLAAAQQQAEGAPGSGDLTDPANTVTGFLLRSALVTGWPDMQVRAFADNQMQQPLRLLRLDLITPGIMLALFDGIAQLIYLEEPHHSVQLGFNAGQSSTTTGSSSGYHRQGPPTQLPGHGQTSDQQQARDQQHTYFWLYVSNPNTGAGVGGEPPPMLVVPMRNTQPGRQVVDIATLAASLGEQVDNALGQPNQGTYDSSGALAVELLNAPWRQYFGGGTGAPAPFGGEPVAEMADTISWDALTYFLDQPPTGGNPETSSALGASRAARPSPATGPAPLTREQADG
jgi:hypothetical protein